MRALELPGNRVDGAADTLRRLCAAAVFNGPRLFTMRRHDSSRCRRQQRPHSHCPRQQDPKTTNRIFVNLAPLTADAPGEPLAGPELAPVSVSAHITTSRAQLTSARRALTAHGSTQNINNNHNNARMHRPASLGPPAQWGAGAVPVGAKVARVNMRDEMRGRRVFVSARPFARPFARPRQRTSHTVTCSLCDFGASGAR